MTKNGLFLVSIGLLIFLYAANQQTRVYDWLSLTTSVFLIILGAFFVLKDKKRQKQQKNKGD